MKKLYAVADEVPEDVDYLTAGKEYEVTDQGDLGFYIVCDDGESAYALFVGCPHLNGGNWRIIEREEEEPSYPLATQVGGNHYKDLAIQPIEYIHKNGIGYAEGSVIKYVTRWRSKNGIEDLRKARHFIDLLIEMEMNNGR